MTDKLIEIADGVVSVLNAGSFSIPFTAARRWRVHFTLEELSTLQVSVRPAIIEPQELTRGFTQRIAVIEVGIQKKPTKFDNVEIDAIYAVVGEMLTALFHLRLTSPINAVCVEASNDPAVDPDHLEEHRVVSSLITLTFEVTQ